MINKTEIMEHIRDLSLELSGYSTTDEDFYIFVRPEHRPRASEIVTEIDALRRS